MGKTIAVFKYMKACGEEVTYFVLRGPNESHGQKLLVFRSHTRRSFKIIRAVQQGNHLLDLFEMFKQTPVNAVVNWFVV